MAASAHNNGGQGVDVEDDATVDDNTVAWNHGNGIFCGIRCSASRNTVQSNTDSGIYVSNVGGTIEDNTSIGNSFYGIYVVTGVTVPNVILRNVATGNADGQYVSGTGSDFGAVGTAASQSGVANVAQ